VIVPALTVSAATLVVGVLSAAGLRRLPSLRWQLTGLALLAGLLPLAAVMLSGVVMFESSHDLLALAVIGASALAALVAAFLLVRWIDHPIHRLRRTAARLAEGDLAARSAEDGPREIADLSRSINAMAGHLEQLFDARRELVAWASHDLRTPLAAMQAMLEAVEDGLVAPERYIPELREQSRLLATLVNDLFELARIDAGSLTLELRDAELDGIVYSCVRGLEAEASAKKVTIDVDVPTPMPAVRCAPDSVSRVLSNLVTNALRHTPADGSVAVRVRQHDADIEVAVEDTGEGFAQEGLTRAFERFWRGDRARTPGQAGAGLGLAIARGLVEANGGRIWAENRPGGGARITFTLPAA
jgi:signal transduction histidine kinase